MTARAPLIASRASARNVWAIGSPIRACSRAWTSSVTVSRSRSSPCSLASCSNRSRTVSPCARCCPRARRAWSSTGRTSASPTTRRRCARGGSASSTSWDPRATSPWRTAAWAASCAGERRPPRTRCRWSTWAATARSRRRRLPPKPPSAPSRRPIAATWTNEVTAEPSVRLTRPTAEDARARDDDRLEDWPAFFTDPCLYSITSVDNHRQGLPAGLMYADSRGMLQDRVAALREANIYERQSYRHLVGLPAILDDKDGALLAETPFLVVRIMRDGRMDLFTTGRYLDVLAEDSGLKFRERIVVCDSSRIDTLLAIPL